MTRHTYFVTSHVNWCGPPLPVVTWQVRARPIEQHRFPPSVLLAEFEREGDARAHLAVLRRLHGATT